MNSAPTRISPFMTAQECGVYIRPAKPVHPQTMYRWAKQGKIPARKINGLVLFHIGDIDQWSASKIIPQESASPTRFEQARMRVRSLKTEYTAKIHPEIQKGMG